MDNNWNQTSYKEFQNSLPYERKEKDAKILAEIFNRAAAKSPTAKSAIEWAQNHGVEFFIDHTCQNVGGYYKQGTGVVAIPWVKDDKYFGLNENNLYAFMTHEIRHALQDYNGLLQDIEKQDFISCYILLSLMEADATAFQHKVNHETLSSLMEECTGKKSTAVYNQVEKFSNWYSSLAPHYGSAIARQYAQELGLEKADAPPDFRCEFEPNLPPIRHTENLSAKDALNAINKDFLGNAWCSAVDINTLAKKLLNPAAAAKFYSDYKKEPDSLVQEICKKQGLTF